MVFIFYTMKKLQYVQYKDIMIDDQWVALESVYNEVIQFYTKITR